VLCYTVFFSPERLKHRKAGTRRSEAWRMLINRVLACNCEEVYVRSHVCSRPSAASPKAPLGAGWLGRGLPVQIGRGAQHLALQDRGGLCSPGNWAPAKRALTPLAAFLQVALPRLHQEAARRRERSGEARRRERSGDERACSRRCACQTSPRYACRPSP
jgi:hypothetical protein